MADASVSQAALPAVTRVAIEVIRTPGVELIPGREGAGLCYRDFWAAAERSEDEAA